MPGKKGFGDSRKKSSDTPMYKMKGNPIRRNFREWFTSTKLGQDLAGARERIQSDITELSGKVVKGFKGADTKFDDMYSDKEADIRKKGGYKYDPKKDKKTKKSKTSRGIVERVEKELKSRDWTPRSVKGGTKAIRERAKKFQKK